MNCDEQPPHLSAFEKGVFAPGAFPFALLIEYDGTDFKGWQLQPEARTVQGVLEDSLYDLTGELVRVKGAGRTDSGVHASGQVALIRMTQSFSPQAVMGALNARLPDDVKIMAVRPAPDSFDPRGDAVMRHYSYRLWNRIAPPVIDRRRWTVCSYHLDFDLMNEGCARLLGEHDFRGFRSATCQARRTRLTINRLCWRSEGEGLWVMDISARSFLHNMVRILVGALVEVGRGFFPLERIDEILTTGDRSRAGRTARPEGLTLEKIDYPPEIMNFGD